MPLLDLQKNEVEDIFNQTLKTFKKIAAKINRKNINLVPLLLDGHTFLRGNPPKLRSTIKVEDELNGSISITCYTTVNGETKSVIESILWCKHKGATLCGEDIKYGLKEEAEGLIVEFFSMITDSEGCVLEEDLKERQEEYNGFLSSLGN